MISTSTTHSSGTVGRTAQMFPAAEGAPARVDNGGEDWHTCEVPLSLIPARISALQGGNTKPKGNGKAKRTK